MDVEWSTVVELEHPWYQGVKLYTISRGAKHNSESYQRYLNCRDLENFMGEFYEEEEESVTEVIGVLYRKETSVMLWSWRQINLYTSCDVPATLNQLGTIVVGGSRSMFAPTLVSCPDHEHFPKMLPGRS